MRELRRRLVTLEAAHVGDQAIEAGWSWRQVAVALGVTKQAAHARHARRTQRAQEGLVVAGRARQAVALREGGGGAARRRAGRRPTTCCSGCCSTTAVPWREALDDCGITCESVRRGSDPPDATTGLERPSDPAVSPNTREVLEQSMREAVERGDARLDVEHLLLAVLHEPGGRGAQAVVAGGSSPRAVERRLRRALRGQPAESSAEGSASS